jgi:hypothetical protein
MTINDIMKKFNTDKEFAAKYSGLHGTDAILAQARLDGYDITYAQLETILAEFENTGIKELDEDDLAVVAGGSNKNRSCPRCGEQMVSFGNGYVCTSQLSQRRQPEE